MGNLKEHIAFKIITLALVISIVIPSIVKFSHVFTHHDHKVCLGEKSTHIHEVDLDCDFHKFKLNNSYYTFVQYQNLFHVTPHRKISTLTYKFLNNHQRLSFSLRGPPFLV
jgi:hypothetical protein